MSSPVSLCRDNDIGVIRIHYPPVNALGQGVREGLQRCLQEALADDQIKAVIVTGEGKTFPAGADIREFGKPPQPPALPDVINEYEASSKPVIAAIHGTALGGGLEVALGCDYRVALDSARLGLPEVKLGLLPGAGGTQRLPRLVGIEAALDMIVGGNPVKAAAAKALGLVDEVVSGDLLEGALAFARNVIDEKAPLRRLCDLPIPGDSRADFLPALSNPSPVANEVQGPFHCIKAAQAAASCPLSKGCSVNGSCLSSCCCHRNPLPSVMFLRRARSGQVGLDGILRVVTSTRWQ